MRLQTNTPEFINDICEVIRLFDPSAEILLEGTGPLLWHTHEEKDGRFIERWSYAGKNIVHEAEASHGGLAEKRFLKRAVKTGCFQLMREHYSECPPWGSLTGIRPTRLLYEAREAGMSDEDSVRWLIDTFYVSETRARLLSDILDMQRGLIKRAPDEFDLYIGIPFCVTRCAYCSFASGELGDGRQVEPYLAALQREMAACAALVGEKGLRPRAFYMGGGTPTALSADQLARVLGQARALFPGAGEWTVEAGRPDTIDGEKLRAMKAHGIDRISVNPQTFSDETLVRIGRAHTSAQTVAAYELAREAGFAHINMDLIAGLPGEDEKIFGETLSRVISLKPESVTVHSLAIKRSSRLHEASYAQAKDGEARRMVDRARLFLAEYGYRPYYLYRQKYMADNLENVGYALPGKACVYNIDIMEETTPVLALGACGITKWLFPRERRIERAANVKNIDEYIKRVDEMVARKRKLILEEG